MTSWAGERATRLAVRKQSSASGPGNSHQMVSSSSSRELWYATGYPGRDRRGDILGTATERKASRKQGWPARSVVLQPYRRKRRTHVGSCRRESLETFERVSRGILPRSLARELSPQVFRSLPLASRPPK